MVHDVENPSRANADSRGKPWEQNTAGTTPAIRAFRVESHLAEYRPKGRYRWLAEEAPYPAHHRHHRRGRRPVRLRARREAALSLMHRDDRHPGGSDGPPLTTGRTAETAGDSTMVTSARQSLGNAGFNFLMLLLPRGLGKEFPWTKECWACVKRTPLQSSPLPFAPCPPAPACAFSQQERKPKPSHRPSHIQA